MITLEACVASHDYSVAYGLLLVSSRYFHVIRRGDRASLDDWDDRLALHHPPHPSTVINHHVPKENQQHFHDCDGNEEEGKIDIYMLTCFDH